jgi:xanthine dehydrogenase FAD-binding subunit
MPLWNHYLIPQTIAEALEALHNAPGDCRLIAGGTDMLLDLQQGRCPPADTLVDITAVDEMTCLEIRNGHLFIGAAVPLNRVASASLAAVHAPALVEACRLIGGPQVRNVATLGGNVGHALPAADGAVAMLALDAQAEVAGNGGRRRVPLASLYKGVGQSTLDLRREIIVGFYIQSTRPGQTSAFARIMRPQGVALPILNMAIWLHRLDDRILDLRLALGPAGPAPQRSPGVETALRGQVYNETVRDYAGQILQENSHFRTSPYRATSEYRKALCEVLFDQLLPEVWMRAGKG